jgi:hypothetical protein
MATSPENLSFSSPPPEDHEDYREVFEQLHALKHPEHPVTQEERSELVTRVLDALKHVPGGVYCSDINDVYRNIQEPVLVRREDPEVALEAILNHEAVTIPFKDAQLNATEWDGDDPRSLRNPFIEGFSHVEGLVTVLGFTKGHDLVKNQANRLADDMKESTIAPERDVSISGTIHVEDMRFLAVRVPTALVPPGEFTQQERDGMEDHVPRYVFRGVLLNGSDTSWQSLH